MTAFRSFLDNLESSHLNRICKDSQPYKVTLLGSRDQDLAALGFGWPQVLTNVTFWDAAFPMGRDLVRRRALCGTCVWPPHCLRRVCFRIQVP